MKYPFHKHASFRYLHGILLSLRSLKMAFAFEINAVAKLTDGRSPIRRAIRSIRDSPLSMFEPMNAYSFAKFQPTWPHDGEATNHEALKRHLGMV